MNEKIRHPQTKAALSEVLFFMLHDTNLFLNDVEEVVWCMLHCPASNSISTLQFPIAVLSSLLLPLFFPFTLSFFPSL